MTYYVIFLKMPDSIKCRTKGFTHSLPMKLKYDKETNLWFGLYAWTTDKKLYKKFKTQRSNKYFVYKKIKNGKGDQFDEYGELCLQEFGLCDKNKRFELVTTEYEFNLSTDDFVAFECFLKNANLPDPIIFSNKLLSLLDKIGYSFSFYSTANIDMDENVSEYMDQLSSRSEMFWYNKSFSCEGYIGTNDKNLPMNNVSVNEFNVFIALFGSLFK